MTRFELYVYPNAGTPEEEFRSAAELVKAAGAEIDRAFEDQDPDREIEIEDAGIAHLKVVRL